MARIWRLRAGLMALVAALGVHEGRYFLAPPSDTHELHALHAYFSWLVPLAASLLFLAFVELLTRLGRSPSAEPRLPSGVTIWRTAFASLVCVFIVQESVENFLAHGHLPPFVELAGHGGWLILPLSAAAAALLALLLRGAAAIESHFFHRRRRFSSQVASLLGSGLSYRHTSFGDVLAWRLAGRAPPLSPLK